jgi:hypothetical protein
MTAPSFRSADTERHGSNVQKGISVMEDKHPPTGTAALSDEQIEALAWEHGEGVTQYAKHRTVEFTADGFRAALAAALASQPVAQAQDEREALTDDEALRLWNYEATKSGYNSHELPARFARVILARAALSASPPPDMVLVPLRPNREMELVMQQEDWQWADLLAAAGTVTEADCERASTPPAAVPEGQKSQEGWKLVPLILTNDMVSAFYVGTFADRTADAVWRAMLKAAPEAGKEQSDTERDAALCPDCGQDHGDKKGGDDAVR